MTETIAAILSDCPAPTRMQTMRAYQYHPAPAPNLTKELPASPFQCHFQSLLHQCIHCHAIHNRAVFHSKARDLGFQIQKKQRQLPKSPKRIQGLHCPIQSWATFIVSQGYLAQIQRTKWYIPYYQFLHTMMAHHGCAKNQPLGDNLLTAKERQQ